MSVDDATLVVELRDETSAGLNRIIGALERYNTATKMSDKSTMALERSLATASAKYAANTGAIDKTTASMSRAAAAARAYQATIDRIGKISTNTAGQAINSRGQFVGTADVLAYEKAVRGLNAIEVERVRNLTAGNRAQAEMSGTMRAALPVGFQYNSMLQGQSAALARVAAQNAALRASQAGFNIGGAQIQNGSFLNASGDVQNVSNGASAAKRSLEQVVAQSTKTRYALYSVSQALGSVGVALLALPVASAILASSYQRDFATVERATLVAGKQAEALKSSLIDLSTTVPVSFKNITDIAAAGAQLGIAPAGLVNFTRVVAQLTATTNLSAEAAENFLGKFAKIAGVPQEKFTNLASSILNVGVHTAATESQIAKLSTQLVGIGREAGFTVPQLIGLAGALASVSSVGPELARGTVTRFVTNIQKAVNAGGPALEAFAKTAGTTGRSVQEAFGTDKFAGVFQDFITGLDGIQEAGGNAAGVLNIMGITSVRDVPLLLNLAAGHRTLAQAIILANEGYADASILQQHYAKINDTLVSKVKELGNTFGSFLNSLGSASTGPIKDVVEGLSNMVKGLTDFSKTDSGQNVLLFIAGLTVLVGVLALVGSGLARVVAGVYAGIAAYDGITKAVATFTAGQRASAAASLTGQSRLQSFASFLTNPYVAAVAIAVVALGLFAHALETLKATDAEVQNVLASGKGFEGITKVLEKGGNGGNLFADLAGADLDSAFKHFNSSVKKQAQLTGGNLWDQIIKGFGQGSLQDAQTQQVFADAMKRTGDSLGTLAQSNLPAAQSAFAQLAIKTDGSKKTLLALLDTMPAYKEELTRQLTVAGDAANANNLLKIAYGGVGDGALDTAGKAKVLTDAIDRQRAFTADLLEVTGLQQKDVDAYGATYQKSIQPLTDFNSIVGQVQATLQASADSAAAASKGAFDSAHFYDGASVSLSQFTAQLEANNQTQATWFQNVITIATQYGQDAATIFINAGYSAVNSSILQQLVDATPEQAQAYIDAQTTAAETAAAATGEALLSAGNLVTSAGAKVGKDTATQIGKELLAGFSPADIMKQYNLTFAKNPAVPQVNTAPAQGKITDFINQNQGKNLSINLLLNTAPANNALANYKGAVSGRVFASGGYTGAGTKFQPAGIVHAGEFVFPQEAVGRIGLPNLYSMMRGQNGASGARRYGGYAEGGAVGGGFSTLDASALHAIMALANRPVILYTTDREIAASASRGNTELAYGGGS